MGETESDDCSIATDSTRTLQRKILCAPWTFIRSFSRDQHPDAEIKLWMEDRAKAIMDQAGPIAGKKILTESLGHFKVSQAFISQAFIGRVFYFYFLHTLSAFFSKFIPFADLQFNTSGWRIKFGLPL